LSALSFWKGEVEHQTLGWNAVRIRHPVDGLQPHSHTRK